MSSDSTSPSVGIGANAKSNHVCVLVVDDEPANRKLLEDLLALDGYQTVSASGGKEALKILLLGDTKIDVVLLDLMMPDLSGMDVLRKLVEAKRIPEVAVIVITADSDRNSLHAALDLGALDYLLKPFDRRELMGRLRSLTAMIAMNNEIKSREQRLEFLVAATDTVLCAFNQGEPATVTYVSPNVKKVLGYEPSVFLKSTFSIAQIIHPDDVEEYQAHIIVARGLSSSVQKYRYRHGDGSWRWMWIDVHLLPRANDPGMEFVVAITDVTEALNTRTGLVEVSAATESLSASPRVLDRDDAELHNLLNVVVSFIEKLDNYRLAESQRVVANEIVTTSRGVLGIAGSPFFDSPTRSEPEQKKLDKLWD